VNKDGPVNLDLAGKHILLTEDIEVNRLIIIEMLAGTQADITEAKNGQDAVEKFSASSPHFFDLIFMDIQMPVMDGYEATHIIRNMALAAGMNGHIAKPIDFDKVKKLLYDMLVKGDKVYAKERN
jgi:CheY-like chemotaxis protein